MYECNNCGYEFDEPKEHYSREGEKRLLCPRCHDSDFEERIEETEDDENE